MKEEVPLRGASRSIDQKQIVLITSLDQKKAEVITSLKVMTKGNGPPFLIDESDPPRFSRPVVKMNSSLKKKILFSIKIFLDNRENRCILTF